MFEIFTAGLLWGGVGIFVNKLLSLGADENLISILRMSSAFLIMFMAGCFKFGKNILIRDKKILFTCILFGIICHGLFNICYSNSIKLNGMGIACVLMYSAPVFTALGSLIIFHEKFSGLKIISLIINISGCILTAAGGNILNLNSSVNIRGLIYGLGSGFCYGMAEVIGRIAGEKINILLVSLYSYFAGMIFLLIFTRPEFKINSEILLTGFLYGLIPTCLAYLFYYSGLKKIKNTSQVPVIASVEPVTALILGYALYYENIGAVNIFGVILVFISILLAIK